ncbi:ATP-binding protein [Reichenbachiella carrageenanivorans]|uniref:histidine kinase n=1 Tax=Reichenbachiella carrageenanivorans TaxID=2979869 RepID=A0ABY6D0Y1_9BACT|nr:hybrid sensor histidine kinase/response regulator transcription factor [Reichenbachiella carrageenanivorans]UXX79812.1 ATP-binding protein [Reichenbachiella carrageenanivorans]
MKKHLVISILLTVSFLYAESQSIKFEHYNDKDGLSHNSIRHIVQDNQGFLWLGTFHGLNRFDGFQFQNYLSYDQGNNTIHDDDITALSLDSTANSLWIGTREGLSHLQIDTHVFTTYLSDSKDPNSLPDEEIRSVYLDKFNRVWVGTKDAGLYLFEPDKNTFTKVPLEGFNYVKAIYEDSKGNIWVGAYETGGVAKIRLGSTGIISEIEYFTLSIPGSTATNPYLYFVYEDDKGDVFAGTREGLYKHDKVHNDFVNLYISDNEVRDKLGPYFSCVAQAPDGKYWVGTLGGLLVCDNLEGISKGDFQWYYSILSEDKSLVDNLISALYFDPSGVLWIGTEEGLDKYDPYENQFKINKDISKYIDNQAPRIRGFSKTSKNEIIVATRHNGLFISDHGDFVPLFNENYDIASIYSYDGVNFYCGLWNGKILAYNHLQKRSKILDVGFKNSPVFSFLELEDQLVVCTFGEGALLLDKHTFKSSVHLLPGIDVKKVTIDEGKNLWFATETGVVRYNLDSRESSHFNENIQSNTGLPHDNVSDIIVDSRGLVWAATREGLGVFDPEVGVFNPVSEPKELNGKWVTDIVEDANGYLWLNMNNNNISRYDVENKLANIYHVNSGNRLDIFSSSGFYNFNNSKIYLGGKNGVIYFSPLSIKENEWSSKPIITEFKVNNKLVLPGLELNGQVPLLKDLNYSRNVSLNYNNRNFSIQFSNVSFTNQRLNTFEYMLEGFDRGWIETGSNSRTVQYTNLLSGNYKFKIRSRNSDGKWSEVSSYNIKILPPFWASNKGIALIFVLLGLIVYFARRQVKERIRLKQELLTEKVQRERDEKLNNEKLRFFTNISHELRTPLSLILGPVKQILEHENSNDFTKNKASLISHSTNRLLRLVNQILDFRRAEAGEIKLKVSQVDILPNTNDIFYSFIELAQSKNINFNFNVEDESIICWIDVDKYNKILYNLLSNALKFTSSHGHVDLFVGVKENDSKTLLIEVSDDGIGIPEESQEKIFSRFYQANNSKESTTGTGIGLSLVKSLVDIHKGHISVRSTTNSGSIFMVELPISKDAFGTEEISSFIVEKQEAVSLTVTKTLNARGTEIAPKSNTDVKSTVLVIDDNAELRNYVMEFLSGHYKVYGAENGKEGLELCRKVKPVICVVDVMMPVMDGFEFVEALKSDEKISHTAVVLLTALGENENKIKGYKIGVDGYLVKPFDPSLLKSRIDNIIKIRLDLKQQFSDETESDVISLAHSQLDIDLISKIKEIIEANLGDANLTPAFLCSELALSSSKLYRKITELTDMSPNEFIRTIRLKKAAFLLKSKNYNVSEVANTVGFNDPLYFSRRFKKQFGYSPSELIK